MIEPIHSTAWNNKEATIYKIGAKLLILVFLAVSLFPANPVLASSADSPANQQIEAIVAPCDQASFSSDSSESQNNIGSICDNSSPIPSPAQGRGAVDYYERLDQLNRAILLKDLELERFNIRFRKENNVQGRWRGPRYFLSSEGNAAATMAGLWVVVAVRTRAIRHPFVLALDPKGKIIQRRRGPLPEGLENGILPQFVGQCLGTAGGAIELGINYFHDYQSRAHGFEPGKAIKHVEAIKKELQALFAERNAVIAANKGKIPELHFQMSVTQGDVLKDLCDLAINEYSRFHVGVRRFRGFQDSLYMMDIAKNMSGAAGNIVAMYATHKRRTTANLTAGLLTLGSGALVFGSPIMARFIGKYIGDKTAHKLHFLLEGSEDADLAKLETDRAKLAGLLKQFNGADSNSDSFFTRVELMDSLNALSSKSTQKKLDLANRELRSATRAATENVTVGALAGGTKIALGTCVMIAGSHFWKRGIESNVIIDDGALAYGCGTSLAVVDNVRIQLKSEISRRRLAKQHLLPGQIFGDHLKVLDSIEAQLNTK